MKQNILLLCIFLSVVSCRNYNLIVTDEVINSDIFGNGVEWDPYDEAISWGSEVSDEDWEKLYKRMDFMRPQYVRCMINSPFTYYDNGSFVPERNERNVIKLLSWCQKNSASVIWGEFNPPKAELKGSREWVEMSVSYLNRLVEHYGFNCIKHFVIFNEPDGNWACTDGDYDFWESMVVRFEEEMRRYPALSGITIAGPDAVLNYRNPASEFDSYGWVSQTASRCGDVVGLYDIHCYPGQHYVRSGSFGHDVGKVRSLVPQDRRFVFGEGGYKYHDPEDSTLLAEYWRRVDKHKFTKGTDCNMLVTDWFYALDMPIFAMEAMNNGASGIAAWMLDDAMHSSGDSGKAEDVKIWGMWNILGSEVFGAPSLETPRPWFYTWSLICRCFPSSSDILRIDSNLPSGVYASASCVSPTESSLVLVNVNDFPVKLKIRLPQESSGSLWRRFTIMQSKEKDVAALTSGNVEIASSSRMSLCLEPESFTALSSLTDLRDLDFREMP